MISNQACSQFARMFWLFSVDGSDVQDEPTSVLSTLLNVNILYGLLMALFSAAIWASIDPILEPELRKKVSYLRKLVKASTRHHLALLQINQEVSNRSCDAVSGFPLSRIQTNFTRLSFNSIYSASSSE